MDIRWKVKVKTYEADKTPPAERKQNQQQQQMSTYAQDLFSTQRFWGSILWHFLGIKWWMNKVKKETKKKTLKSFHSFLDTRPFTHKEI